MLTSSTAAAPPEAPGAETESSGEFGPPSGIGSRSEAFGQGTGAVAPAAAPASLQQDQAQANAGPKQFTPNGTNMQLTGSGMGSSPQDQSRMLVGGGFLPTSNGSALDSYAARRTIMSTTTSR